MVTSQKTTEEESMEQYSLLLTRNLLRIAIYNISYIRGLFPEKYFNDKSVPALGMSIKKLMPMDAESRRLINWTEQGVWDALQKKHLKTLLFCICEMDEGQVVEEYAFSFSYPKSSDDEVIMELSLMGSKVNGATFKLNAAEVTPDRMRSSAYIMIRTLVSLTRTLDQTPDERTILMKLLYYDDVTPEDYEPPFFKCCADNQAISIWNKNPLKMELGNVKNKHLVLALKVDVHLDPYDDSNAKREHENMSLEYDNQDEDSSETEVNLANSFGRLCCISKRGPLFHLDSGASHHICVNKSYMKDFRTIKEHQQVRVTSVDGKEFTAEEIGTIAYPSFNLSQVRFMPSMTFSVVSIGQLDKQGLLISICNGEFHIFDVNNSILVGEGYRHIKKNDYVFRAIHWVPEDQTDVGQLDIVVPQTNSVLEDYDVEKDWVIDSCCPCHMAGKFEMLTNHTGFKKKFHTPAGEMKSTHQGSVKNADVNLHNVIYCPANETNILSVAALDKDGYRFTFFNRKCGIVFKDTLKEVGYGELNQENNLYYLMELSIEKGQSKRKRN